jgi:hypothetical protein
MRSQMMDHEVISGLEGSARQFEAISGVDVTLDDAARFDLGPNPKLRFHARTIACIKLRGPIQALNPQTLKPSNPKPKPDSRMGATEHHRSLRC